MKKFFENKPRAWFTVGALFVVILSVIGIGASYFYKDTESTVKVLAKVGDDEITLDELNQALYEFDFQGTPENPGKAKDEELKKIVLDKLIDESIITQEASKRGIEATENEILATANENVPDYQTLDEEKQKLILRNMGLKVLETKLKEQVLSYVEGKYLLIRFDKYLGDSLDEKKYNQERIAAKEFAESLYGELSSEKISFEEAKQKILKHPTFGEDAFAELGFTTIHWGFLNKDVYENGLGIIRDENFQDLVGSVEVGSVSEPKLLTVNASPGDSEERIEKDGIYSIIIVDKKIDGEASSFDEWLENKKKEYNVTKLALILDLLRTQKAYAKVGTCSGGLVESGSNKPAGFFMKFIYRNAAGTEYAASGSKATLNTSSTSSYTWGSKTKYCSSANVVELKTYPDGFHDGYTFTADTNGWVYIGGDSAANYSGYCGGSGFGLPCSCKSTFSADLSYGAKPEPAVGGYWSNIRYYFTDGTYKDYPGSDPFSFSAIGNGATAGFYATLQANRPPTVSATNHSTTIADAINYDLDSTTRIYLNAKAVDPDADQVKYRVAYKKSQDGGASWGGFTYYPSSDTWTSLTDSNTNRTVKSYLPSELGEGLYYWVVLSADEHGLVNARPSGSSNEWSHNDPRYFKITTPNVPPPPNPEITCIATPEFGVAPKTIRFDITGTDLSTMNFSLTPGSGISPLAYTFNTGSPYSKTVFYTYNDAGEYDAYITHADFPGAPKACGATISIENPGSGGGGEVAP